MRDSTVEFPSKAFRDRITVCICTFKRPGDLTRLLDALDVQKNPCDVDIVVVDNDRQQSAALAVSEFCRRSKLAVLYDVEPEQNISLSRNRAVANASGNLLAFIDDDERPERDWLTNLYRTLNDSGADGVLGPVVPDFPRSAPGWVRKARVFNRPRHQTGTHIGSQDARTGNVLMRRSLFQEGSVWFDPRFGRTGGEDSDFFARQFDQGRTFVWCDEAVCCETVPAERWTVAFHVKRYLRSGTIDGELLRNGPRSAQLLARNAATLLGCAIVTPLSLVLPKHIWMRFLQKLAYCSGLISAYCGWSLLRERD